MYDDYNQTAWRTDEQLLDEALRRVFGDPPKMDAKFSELLNKLGETSERQDDKEG